MLSLTPAPSPEPHVVAAGVYAGGRRVADIPIDEAGKWAKQPGHVVWIGLFEPNPEQLQRVQQQFDLHPLAVEDACKAHQRPKLERHGDALFVVARTAQMVDGHVAFGETHIFVGHGYVVSVRHGASTSYTAVRQRCETSPQVLAHGEDYILYSILDFVVDNYQPVLEAIHAEVEQLEDRVFESELTAGETQRLFGLRRDLLRLRDAAGPLVDVCRGIEHSELSTIDQALMPLFRDVTDHVNRINESIDALREVVAFAFEASLMIGQARQTAITRQLAAWAAILAVPTAIAGIYGMNFEHMPELKTIYGYPLVLTAILAVCTTLYVRFRRNGWL
jgi:magnesium transporter